MQSHQFQSSIKYGNVDIDYQAGILNFLLGMEYVLYAKTQNFHWNLIGINFAGLHKLLDKHYHQIGKFIDRIAEQIRKYGKPSPGSLQEFIILNNQANGIEEIPGGLLNETNVIALSVVAHEKMIQTINSLETGRIDLATQNLLGDILDFHMTASWMMRSHLQ
jgi:starvation-inducible DNA-binding protein